MSDAHGVVLAQLIDLAGADVLDVGCGAGAFVRWLRAEGARPIGAEVSPLMRSQAVAADPDHVDDYVDAVAESLPFPDASFDVVVFSYSLHHVPAEAMADGLAEARRVLRPEGVLFVVEPVPVGPEHEIAALIDDETEVRGLAQAALDEMPGFAALAVREYDTADEYPDWDAWEAVMVGVDPTRAELMDAHRDTARAMFEATAERTAAGAYRFVTQNLARVFRAA